jgi:hypothetical protein
LNFVAAAPTRPFRREEPFCCRRLDSNGAKNSKAHQIHAYYRANTEGDENRMFALVTASQMASASAASFFCRLRRFN